MTNSNQSPQNDEQRKEKKSITRNIFIVVVIFFVAVGLYMFNNKSPEPGEKPASEQPPASTTATATAS